jgi:hypothetical protein
MWIRTRNEEMKKIFDRKNTNIKYIYKPKISKNTLNVRNSEQKFEKEPE